MSEPEYICLESLLGEHVLDAVDLSAESVENYGSFENANVIRFRLDGIVYTAVEDPSDGYRSSLRHLFAEKCDIGNTFHPIRVVGHMKPRSERGDCDILELIDVQTGKVVVEVGTDNSDDYYPSFVGHFSPENMATNASNEESP